MNQKDLTPPKETGRRGLECPRCGCRHFQVIYTRPVDQGRIRRRRECRNCSHLITTCEQAIG